MGDNIIVDILLNGTELNFDAKLVFSGYSYKIVVNVDEMEVSFEPDESRNYRAIVQDQFVNKLTNKDKLIIQLITERLDSLKE